MAGCSDFEDSFCQKEASYFVFSSIWNWFELQGFCFKKIKSIWLFREFLTSPYFLMTLFHDWENRQHFTVWKFEILSIFDLYLQNYIFDAIDLPKVLSHAWMLEKFLNFYTVMFLNYSQNPKHWLKILIQIL